MRALICDDDDDDEDDDDDGGGGGDSDGDGDDDEDEDEDDCLGDLTSCDGAYNYYLLLRSEFLN